MQSKRLFALFLLVLVSIKTLLVPVVYLDFELRKEYIIKHLCENRFRPERLCNGQCYLSKALGKLTEEKATKEAERQSQQIKKVLEEVFEEVPFFRIESASIELFRSRFPAVLEILTTLHRQALFRPPIP